MLATAKKCRFCQEFLDASLRAADDAKKKSGDTLTPGDLQLCILCSPIGFVMGLLYVIQGKNKGWKMVALSALTLFLYAIVKAL